MKITLILFALLMFTSSARAWRTGSGENVIAGQLSADDELAARIAIELLQEPIRTVDDVLAALQTMRKPVEYAALLKLELGPMLKPEYALRLTIGRTCQIELTIDGKELVPQPHPMAMKSYTDLTLRSYAVFSSVDSMRRWMLIYQRSDPRYPTPPSAFSSFLSRFADSLLQSRNLSLRDVVGVAEAALDGDSMDVQYWSGLLQDWYGVKIATASSVIQARRYARSSLSSSPFAELAHEVVVRTGRSAIHPETETTINLRRTSQSAGGAFILPSFVVVRQLVVK